MQDPGRNWWRTFTCGIKNLLGSGIYCQESDHSFWTCYGENYTSAMIVNRELPFPLLLGLLCYLSSIMFQRLCTFIVHIMWGGWFPFVITLCISFGSLLINLTFWKLFYFNQNLYFQNQIGGRINQVINLLVKPNKSLENL